MRLSSAWRTLDDGASGPQRRAPGRLAPWARGETVVVRPGRGVRGVGSSGGFVE